MRISDWSSDVCSSDLIASPSRLRALQRKRSHLTPSFREHGQRTVQQSGRTERARPPHRRGPFRHRAIAARGELPPCVVDRRGLWRSEERRVGKECVSTVSSRWSQEREKKKIKNSKYDRGDTPKNRIKYANTTSLNRCYCSFFFFFQAEDGIRDAH